MIEALGDMIRIDEIRALHHDLHMRPFEGDRRVYLIFDAHRMNDEAAAALLKDLEEPPGYATLVLVADELGSLPETIRSRCQLVPFRRLSRRAVEEWLAGQAPDLDERPGGGACASRRRPSRPRRRLLDDAARAPRAALLTVARGAYLDEAFHPSDAAAVVLGGSRRAGGEGARAGAAGRRRARASDARGGAACHGGRASAPSRTRSSPRSTISPRGTATSSRPAGAEAAVVNADRLDDLRADVERGAAPDAEDAAALVRQAWREAEEFNLNPTLAPRGALRPPAARVSPEPPSTRRYTGPSADVAQLVEHFTRNEGVRGSSPRVGFQH